jgi:hypothetical protein
MPDYKCLKCGNLLPSAGVDEPICTECLAAARKSAAYSITESKKALATAEARLTNIIEARRKARKERH